MNYDFIIIGQGLAGSLLAWHLIKAGQQVLVVDDMHHTAASRVAAGMINPLAGMRFNCHPNTPHWLGSALKLYRSIEQTLHKRYWYPMDMQRLFRSVEQKRFYTRQLNQSACHTYLGAELTAEDFHPGLQIPHGGFWQYQTGYVDMPNLLSDMRQWLQRQNALLEQVCQYDQIALSNGRIAFQDIHATGLVFCEGYRMGNNPWFKHLPLQPDKGEILTLSMDEPVGKTMINGAHWLIPLHNGDWRFGATHQHQDINNQATAAGKTMLQQGLNQLFKSPDGLRIQSHQAGVRPGTQDRQPFVSSHIEYPQLHIFNGFGARGALTIPWYAQRFVGRLLSDC